jgi:hypothetical protein
MPLYSKISKKRKSSRTNKINEINKKKNTEELIKFIEENKNTDLFIDDSMSNNLCISTREGMCSRIKLFTNLTQIEKHRLILIFEDLKDL